jgi:hypothetical protein
VLVRPLRARTTATSWSPASAAGAPRAGRLREIPALIEQIDDDTALEIALIENLQREDLSPLEEALMYERMTSDHGYSVRKLAQKIGKDKGYVENRLRLADAPTEIKQLVSLRKDTVSHAYELLKVEDPRSAGGWPSRSPAASSAWSSCASDRGPTAAAPRGRRRSPACRRMPRRRQTTSCRLEAPAGQWPTARRLAGRRQAHPSEALDELAAVLGSPDALARSGRSTGPTWPST